MKNLFLYFPFILVLTNIGCYDFDDDSLLNCTGPKTSTLSGVVIDNYTRLPISNAEIEFSNFSFSAEASRMTTTSNSDGRFSFTDTGCSFTDDLFAVRSIRHKDYDGSASTFSSSDLLEEATVLLYKTRNFNLIFNNSNFQAEDEIDFRYNFCIHPNSTCFSFGDYGTINSTGVDTLAVEVAQGEILEVRYNLNDKPRTNIEIPTEGFDEFVIEL